MIGKLGHVIGKLGHVIGKLGHVIGKLGRDWLDHVIGGTCMFLLRMVAIQ